MVFRSSTLVTTNPGKSGFLVHISPPLKNFKVELFDQDTQKQRRKRNIVLVSGVR